ncbi:unnamed protein product [Penicillium salamii]|uniref:Uncharacterized protein n=1 Tax=Penicillium salamii TaxID=1612424 RepID=A0A9W4K2G5_9EURO|nr:unnamed protein product [Penicillium salamii]CAG8099924.1 unnamed protein product [Penicillium salamii]CAG8294827.1 unnamed protein product [Penicillium salamii]CAG8324081.1 unnamed protein product [Penicillium salamii]CAG8417748.1 unnamed protein product [Penicillium salamii]
MLGRLAANLRERQGIAGTGLEGLGATGENATVVLDDNCTVCIGCSSSLNVARSMLTV